MSLAHRTYSAVRWTAVSTVMRAILQVAQVAILVRLLTPTDYGLMAMVTVVMRYVGLFSDMGLSEAFVQRRQISHEERSSLYWLSVSVGTLLMLIVMSLSPLAAMFFHEPRLIEPMLLLSSNFLIVALGQQLRVDAEKSLHFRPVALIEISAALVGFVVAVLAAWLKWGVYALVAGTMVSIWLTMILSWALLANGWRPAWRLRWSEVRWFTHFGGGMVINNVCNHINTTIDLLLAGRLLGANQLGLYSVPRNLILQVQFMINPIVTRVGFPLIASIQHDQARVRQIYLKTMNMTASVNAPIYVALAFFAPEFVSLIFGSKWQGVDSLLRVMAIWGLLRSFGNPVGSLLFGMGRIRLSTKWNALLLLIVPPSIWVGTQYGALGTAWTMAALMAILFVPAWAILIRPVCGARLGEYAKQVAVPVVCALLAGSIAWLVANHFESATLRLCVGLSLGAIAYIVVSWGLNRDWCLTMLNASRLSEKNTPPA